MQASDPAARAIDSNLYVASLPEWFTDADLYELFRRFGPILSAKVMCHKGTHHCKGYGFVLFQRTDDAAAARSEMIGHVVGGNKIQVRRARSAASAPLGECGSTLFAETPQHLRGGGCSDGVSKLSLSFQQPQPQQQQLSNTSALNASPQFTAATCCAPQPFHSMYSNMPAYVMSGSRNSSGHSGVMNSHANPSRSSAQTMFVAIPNGRNVAQGPDNVVYMVLTSPHMQPSNVIF
jgi:RNA recognition motif-containing protein